MTDGTPTDHAADRCKHAASRRAVLMCAGLVGAGGAAVLLGGCSTAAVPYDANDEGQAPGPDLAVTSAPSSAALLRPPRALAAASSPAAAAAGTANADSKASSGASGTLLGRDGRRPGRRREGLHRREGRGHPADQGRLQGIQRGLHPRRVPVQPGRGRHHRLPVPRFQVRDHDRRGRRGPAPSPLPAAPINVSDGKILLQ